jgi:hypothetical protein
LPASLHLRDPIAGADSRTLGCRPTAPCREIGAVVLLFSVPASVHDQRYQRRLIDIAPGQTLTAESENRNMTQSNKRGRIGRAVPSGRKNRRTGVFNRSGRPSRLPLVAPTMQERKLPFPSSGIHAPSLQSECQTTLLVATGNGNPELIAFDIEENSGM